MITHDALKLTVSVQELRRHKNINIQKEGK